MAPMDRQIDGGWDSWAKHVLIELERLDKEQKDDQKELQEVQKALEDKVNSIKLELAELKIKTGVLGTIAGAIGAGIAILIQLALK